MIDKKIIFENLYNIFDKIPIPNYILGQILRIIHFLKLQISLAIFIWGSKIACIIVIIFHCLIAISFNLFKGCIFTKLEMKLCQDKFTVVDPCMEFLGHEITYDNRMKFSYNSIINDFILFFIMFYMRFGLSIF